MAATLYEVLGISNTATAAEVKRAYRRVALKKHPDTNPSPNAKEEFNEVVRAYEVLSDEKRRRDYDTKLRFTSPFGAGGGRSTGYSSASSSRGRSSYDPRRAEEAARRWREQNPTPDQIDDSFGDIFRDLVGSIAFNGVGRGGRGVLNDVVEFLEKGVEGFSSDTSSDFEDLMSSENLEEIVAELENARFLLEQLEIRRKKLDLERLASEREVAASRAGSRGAMDIEELDRRMAVVQRAAGIKARSEEMQGHVKRAKARIARLERKVADVSRGRSQDYRAQGTGGGGGSSYRSGFSYSAGTGRTAAGGGRGGSGTSSRTPSNGGDRRGSAATGAREGGETGGDRKTRPPPGNVSGNRNRRGVDDPAIDEELAKLKRDMGLS